LWESLLERPGNATEEASYTASGVNASRAEDSEEGFVGSAIALGESEDGEVAVTPVVSMEALELLLSVDGIVGGIEVDDDLFGRSCCVASDEVVHDGVGETDEFTSSDVVLETGEGGLRSERVGVDGPPTDGDAEHGIVPHRVVVIGVLVSGSDGEDALAEHLLVGDADASGIAGIDQALGKTPDEPELSIELRQEQQPTIRGEVSSIESGTNGLGKKGIESGLERTLCGHEMSQPFVIEFLTNPMYERLRSISCLLYQSSL
jgi:hypothetical protein